MHFNKKNIPNCITSIRLLGAAALFFIKPFTMLFYVIYTVCGVTDVLDGMAARKLNASSEFGSFLDSVSDLVFYSAMLLHVIPYLWKRVPVGIWYAVGVIIVLRVISYTLAGIKYHRFASLHTYGNKITGFYMFALPYSILLFHQTAVCVTGCTLAMLSTVEELVIHLKSSSYDSNAKTIIYLIRKAKGKK